MHRILKEISEMTTDELKNERDELLSLLFLVKEESKYGPFRWNGLNFLAANKRYHQICQYLVFKENLNKNNL
jgi:hypothetical protein